MTTARLATSALQLFLVVDVIGLVALCARLEVVARRRDRAGRCPR